MADHKAEVITIPNKYIPSMAVRRYVYGVIAAALGVALIYGLVNAEQVSAWVILGTAICGLSNGLAFANAKDTSE